ncbi:MAG: arylsulfatase [Trueperaceae bacterium]|nr:arylsulfatase [Trueperaceae bacterium]
MKTQNPNIVLVMADDMGYGDPGCYNPESKIPTPNIDRLAREGTRFTDAHSPCALCTPSRYGLLTGRYHWRTAKPHTLVMPYEPPIIEASRTTIASMLKGCGYKTACIGKWHLGFLYPSKVDKKSGYTEQEGDIDFHQTLDGGPLELGFDYFYGTAGCSTSDPPYCFIENNRAVDIPSISSPEALNELPGFYPGLMVPQWVEAEVDIHLALRARAHIAEQIKSSPKTPFFLYFALSAPHNPWVVPEFLKGSSGDGLRGDMNVLADWCLGQIYEELSKQGLLDNTLIIYTSDHGPQYNIGKTGHRASGFFRGHKNTAFEGGHRVPFVVRWPGKVISGTTSDHLICHTDLLATFAELTGQPLPEGAGEDSFSAFANLLGKGQPQRPAFVADTGHHGLASGDFSIRHDGWKLIIMAPRRQGDSEELLLFNLNDDPFEQNDVKAVFPEQVSVLEMLLYQVKHTGSRYLKF